MTEIPGAMHWEMEDVVAAGLSPREALEAATRVAAEVAGVDEVAGTLAPGYFADLLLLDENPLEDIRATRAIRHLILQGRVVDRDALLVGGEWVPEP